MTSKLGVRMITNPKPSLFLPSRLVAEGVPIPDGWVLHPMLDGWVPLGDTAVTTEQAARQNTSLEA